MGLAAGYSIAHASGFQLIEQSVSGMGTAYAGGAAEASDATTVYFNPAGLTELNGTQGIAGVHIVIPQAEFTNKGSTFAPLLGGAPLSGGNGGDGGETGVVPHLYFSHRYSDSLVLGLGINAPFGLTTEYDNGWVGRYHALKSEVKTININPAIGYSVNDRISVGAGINYQYIDAELTNAIDFGSIGALSGQPLAPGSQDGHVRVSGDDWSWGYNLGLLIKADEQTRIGIHYRSEIKHTLSGDADFTVPANPIVAALATGLNLVDTNVESRVKLPATISLSAFHQLNDQWAIMADVSRTDWSSLQELRFKFGSGAENGVSTQLAWEDSIRVSAGASYKPQSSGWILRGGIAHDQTPIPNEKYRTPRIPGNDRIWLALGAGYHLSDSFSFDIGYAHLFVDDPLIEKVADPFGNVENLTRGALKGEYDASVDIVSAQLRWVF